MRSPSQLVAFLLFAALSLYGCSCFVPVVEKQCDEKTPCGSGWICINTRCFPPDAGKAGGGVGGSGGAGGGGFAGGEGGGVGGGGYDPLRVLGAQAAGLVSQAFGQVDAMGGALGRQRYVGPDQQGEAVAAGEGGEGGGCGEGVGGSEGAVDDT